MAAIILTTESKETERNKKRQEPLEIDDIKVKVNTQESVTHLPIYTEQTEEKVEEVEHEIPVRVTNIIFLAITYALGSFIFAYNLGAFNSIQENINFDLKWKKEEKEAYISFISGMIPIGAIFGAAIQGKMAAGIGRKLTFIVLDGIGISGIAISMVAHSVALIVGRLIIGFTVGGYSMLVPLIIAEIFPKKYIGIGITITNIGLKIGLLVLFSLGINIPPTDQPDFIWWRWYFSSLVELSCLI